MNAIAVAGPVSGRQLHKFGGSSLADVKCYLRVAGIMAEYSQPGDMMVVSAAGSTTNQLINWLKLSQSDRLSAHRAADVASLSQRSYQRPVAAGKRRAADRRVHSGSGTPGGAAGRQRRRGVLRRSGRARRDLVGAPDGGGAQPLDMQAARLDARDFLRAERAAQPQVDEGRSYPLLQQLLAQHPGKRPVVTGFISRNDAGETVLLGRNGSDYSATQVGALAGAARVTIWSDVAGVYSADPRKVKDACLLPLLRGRSQRAGAPAAPVLHTRTLQPVSGSDIDLQLRCSYQPEQGSTRIERVLASGTGAKIVTSHDDVCLIELHVAAQHDFKLAQKELDLVLKRAQIKPLAVGIHPDRNPVQLCYTSEVVNSALATLQASALPGELHLREGLALVAMVGAGVCKNPLHSHRFYQQLKDQPVEFIWQAEDGISTVAVLRRGRPRC